MTLINKRVKILVGRDKGKFGTILEITKINGNNSPEEILVELNDGKIREFSVDDLQILAETKLNERGKYDIIP